MARFLMDQVVLGLVSLLWALTRTQAEVIVETTRNLRPFRMYEDMPARFGAGLPDAGLVGYLVVAEPIHGCGPLQPPPGKQPLSKDVHWVALIRDRAVLWYYILQMEVRPNYQTKSLHPRKQLKVLFLHIKFPSFFTEDEHHRTDYFQAI